jgi:hypothetical protein
MSLRRLQGYQRAFGDSEIAAMPRRITHLSEKLALFFCQKDF